MRDLRICRQQSPSSGNQAFPFTHIGPSANEFERNVLPRQPVQRQQHLAMGPAAQLGNLQDGAGAAGVG